MKPVDDLLPEEQDSQYEELITLLQQANHSPMLVDPGQRTETLSRVRTRLMQTDAKASTGAMPVAADGRLVSSPVRSEPQTRIQRPGKQVVRLLNALAAVLVVGALVGAMLLLLSSHRSVPATGGVSEKGCISSSASGLANDYDLSAVAALSRNDIWIVGGFNPPRDHALIEHWNGSKWCISRDPYSITGQGVPQYVSLRAVSATSTNDVWAVGDVEGEGDGPLGHTLIEHWNGSRWSVIPGPTIGTGGRLTGVAAISPTDAWAVGYYTPDISADERALIEHWNGKKWSIISSPLPSLFIEFHSITALSANDIWAVGALNNETLIEHWNGKQWSIVSSPNPGTSSNTLWGVAALSASDVWAVGGFSNNAHGQEVSTSLTLHWNGSRWSIVSSASSNSSRDTLTGVTARSANDVWAVGTPYNMLVEHWDGSRWSVIRRNMNTSATLTAAVFVPHSNTIVAVGLGALQYFKDPDGAILSKP